jgi:hypothetical protein
VQALVTRPTHRRPSGGELSFQFHHPFVHRRRQADG